MGDEKRRSILAAATKTGSEKGRVRECMLLMQMLLKTDPHLAANLAAPPLSAVEMRRVSDPTRNPTPTPTPTPTPPPPPPPPLP